MFEKKVATKAQLFKMGVISSDDDRICYVCSLSFKTLDHLIMSCACSKVVRCKVSLWLGIPHGVPKTVVDHFLWFKEVIRGKALSKKRLVIWLTTCWHYGVREMQLFSKTRKRNKYEIKKI